MNTPKNPTTAPRTVMQKTVLVPRLSSIPVPSVHLNGTSRDALIRQLLDAHDALRQAVETMQDGAPHARDYYTQADPDAFTKARNAHFARLAKIEDVQNELFALAEAIDEQ
jgi:hypothetical protein